MIFISSLSIRNPHFHTRRATESYLSCLHTCYNLPSFDSRIFSSTSIINLVIKFFSSIYFLLFSSDIVGFCWSRLPYPGTRSCLAPSTPKPDSDWVVPAFLARTFQPQVAI
ncbi:Hypothetical_protein [Hexamita inflata]|uniref:Hypothetical_protein n=1 Tax=Hexamita inflata TaxID=28002 RepID=A0AA86UZ29_9EUKA|nr:Hypothetical protein HINF_LOCUS65475 [Hexamita inflata]